jgi:cellobiose-specific phosphotransferase system component IIB
MHGINYNTCSFRLPLLQAIVLFCGLGINNTMLYDQMAKAKAKQQVALEVGSESIQEVFLIK